METKCSSTGHKLTNDVQSASFPCPNCGKEVIHRSGFARKISAKYTCGQCGFEGPN